MSNPLRTPEDYELFLYTIVDSVQSVKLSSVTFVRIGASLARVEGEIQFENQFRLVVRERIIFDRLPAIIDWYGYEVWRRDEKLYWYDSQPHPNDYKLKISHPHHKHVPPNIKHNRIPASEMSFTRPNLPVLIKEVEGLGK
ncbi:MAG: hypothetical protein GY941_14190 [Planctomycetes bacterium]|nr:hypothetical protein [Planctomycetota bacterium]